MHGMTVIYVTDFTSNELFWQNANHSDYPRSRIIMQIAIFGDRQRDKVAFLKQGDRVFLTNVRCKLDKQGNLEGHVGERNMFRVEKLTKADEGYRLLEVRSVALTYHASFAAPV